MLDSRILLLDPGIVLMGTEPLNCNNAGNLVRLKICAGLARDSCWAYSTSGALSSGSPSTQTLRPVSLAVSLLHSIAMFL